MSDCAFSACDCKGRCHLAPDPAPVIWRGTVAQEGNGMPCPCCGHTMIGESALLHLVAGFRDVSRCPTLDHIIPRSRGGAKHREDNLIVVCYRCNQAKKNMTWGEWLPRLALGLDPRAPRVAILAERYPGSLRRDYTDWYERQRAKKDRAGLPWIGQMEAAE